MKNLSKPDLNKRLWTWFTWRNGFWSPKKNVSVSQLDNGNVLYFNLILIYQVKVWPERYRQLKKVN